MFFRDEGEGSVTSYRVVLYGGPMDGQILYIPNMVNEIEMAGTPERIDIPGLASSEVATDYDEELRDHIKIPKIYYDYAGVQDGAYLFKLRGM